MSAPGSPTAPATPTAGRIATLLRACGRSLLGSRLIRTAGLALVAGIGIGVYARSSGGSERLEQGGWTAAVTSVSLIAAYVAGFAIRRALRLVLALAAAAAGVLVILQVSGVDVSASDVAAAAWEEAEKAEGLVRSWLPSGAASLVGLFFGMRRGKRGE
jgi:uncharacterized membrane protein (Fun14 family)